MKTIIQALEEIIPQGERCEGCPKADPYITGSEGPILKGYQGPYFCHLMEEVIEDGEKKLFVSMTKDGKCITEEGEDSWIIWNNLALFADQA